MFYLQKLVIGVLSSIVLMSPTPANANWVLIGGNDKKFYYDPDTIVRKNDVARYWSAIMLETPKDGLSAIQLYNSLDCRKEVLSIERAVAYDSKGNVVTDHNVTSDQKDVAVFPRFAAVLMLDFICKK